MESTYRLLAQHKEGYWAAHAPASLRLSVLDLDTSASAADPYAGLKQDFPLAKDLIAATAVAPLTGRSTSSDRRHPCLKPTRYPPPPARTA
ncbi:MAG TPA: hypothetical protein VMT29_14755, partial [Steroidobacteraceae bacterium]|nr:hypothetical protein [Steroidobacteraceae bacterium]